MFLSKKLIQYISPEFKNITNSQLINAFNAIGVEVEKVETIPLVNNLVFGRIKSFYKIEGSKNLNSCVIETSNGELNIVCGASNLELNKIVVVAKIGAKFSNDFIISSRKLLNHESNGMICGYNEIFKNNEKFMSNDDKQGVIIIEDNLDLNSSVYDFLNLDDEIFELSLPSNRNDLNGVLSLINELNYQLKLNFKIKNKKIKKINSENIKIASSNINSYVISMFQNKISKKNWFIKTILVNSKINSISDIVDISNFVTLLTANPIHFYDADKINNELTIIDSTLEYNFNTINNETLKLPINSTISIHNNEVSSLIGIIGSNKTMVTNDTKNILVEILNIDNQYVNNLSSKININNNSSTLFSKKLSTKFVRLSYWVLNEILLKQGIKLKILASQISKKTFWIKINLKNISNILGIRISMNDIIQSLSKSGIKFFCGFAIIPDYRIDISSEQDLAEEILKTFDINKFPEKPILNYSRLSNNLLNYDYDKIYELKIKLTTLGLFELKTMNLVSNSIANSFNFDNLEPIKISNPISNLRKNMKTSILPSLIEVFENNNNVKEEFFNSFEMQKIYSRNNVKNKLAILLSTNIFEDIEQENNLSIADAKLVINKIEDYFNFKFNFKQSTYKEFTNNQFDIFLENKKIGYVGEINYKNKKNIYGIELELCSLLSINPLKTKYKEKSLLNPIYRELTFSNPNKNSIIDYIKLIKKENALIEDVIPLKIFKNKAKSTTTLKIKINQNKLLTNQEIETIFKNCILKLKDFDFILNDEK